MRYMWSISVVLFVLLAACNSDSRAGQTSHMSEGKGYAYVSPDRYCKVDHLDAGLAMYCPEGVMIARISDEPFSGVASIEQSLGVSRDDYDFIEQPSDYLQAHNGSVLVIELHEHVASRDLSYPNFIAVGPFNSGHVLIYGYLNHTAFESDFRDLFRRHVLTFEPPLSFER